MTQNNLETDVVVAGSGLAGLVSTARALEHDADVVLLEKGYQLGGTTVVTGGYVKVSKGLEPQIDAYEPIEDGLAWLKENGFTVRDDVHLEREHGDPKQSIAKIEPPDLVKRMEELITSNGGRILKNTPLKEVTVDGDGAVTGVIAYDYDHGQFEVHAPSVILATGGYSGNEGLVSQFFPNADLWLGRDPWTTGDGFLAAQDLGAKTTGELTHAIGVSRPAPPAEITFDDIRCGQIYDTSSIALDVNGRRFTDESKSKMTSQSDVFILDFLKHVEGTGWLVIDEKLYQGDDRYQSSVKSRVEMARELGGPVLEADSLEELGRKLGEVGVNGRRAVETIEEFNEAMRTGDDADLDPPRSHYRDPVDESPFRAIGVIPGILYFIGGLDINKNAQVISRAVSTSSMRNTPARPGDVVTEPIPGLYAAGVEVGQHDYECYYRGGLSLALSTGRIAGKHAALYATGKLSESLRP